ncbi:hypothetical protein CPT03_03865 [Pedobacter ginsengisoli]|uniref:DUF2652 domain-containing protein n=1 Tax=Pedobacter ginsengisoli TaxID=363852 RepID=A0A2D1U243_9SPHI|nr:DUF2652 domain-containing protein [Pedobacter ginsengisoli]ATP55663.1 hypothetical protein CPT03_03865 [Pedobacter ginsengisoli]
METKGLLFIPDISGFTRFVTESEINHSRMIIQELLELLINANQIGLEVSEIEGDAILFYKFGEPPELEVLYKQVEKMFCLFHKSLMSYDRRKYCQCNACTSAANLSLKVITHYGEFTGYNVKNFSKLIGKDVIVAHQLLKNDIKQHEYWLVTNGLLQDNAPADFKEWMNWNDSMKQTETGEIYFHYTQLSQLKNEIADDPLPPLNLSGKKKICTVSKTYETDIITLFHASGAFEYRHLWWDGVKKVEGLQHFLPRVGMKSTWTLNNGETLYYSNSYSYTDDRIEFSEMNDKGDQIIYFTLIKVAPNETNLTIDIYKTSNWITNLISKLSNQKEQGPILQKSLEKIVPLLKDIHL